jgi:hypothetical protein
MHTGSLVQGNAPHRDSSCRHRSAACVDLRNSRNHRRADAGNVSKSTVAIAVMGLLACGVLSLLMKQVVGLQAEQRRAPWLPAVEVRFDERIVGPVMVRDEPIDDGVRVVVSVRAEPGVDAARLAQAIGADVWLHLGRAGSAAKELVVAVRHGEGGAPRRFPIAHPAPGR